MKRLPSLTCFLLGENPTVELERVLRSVRSEKKRLITLKGETKQTIKLRVPTGFFIKIPD